MEAEELGNNLQPEDQCCYLFLMKTGPASKVGRAI